MKTRFFRLLGCIFLCLLVARSPRLRAAQATDWNVAALDQILAGVNHGQKLVTIGDMQILVANLTAWRNQLAGTPSPQSAFDVTPSWTDGNVYYEFSTDGTNAVPPILQKAFLDAAAEWALFANLHFVAHTTQSNYVTVQVDSTLEGGFSSAVGMVGGQQFLSISPNAWNRGTLCHEIGHVLGLVHEHQRSDRDSFVTILSSNVVSGGIGNFVLLPNSRNQGAYDFLSVMHYARNYLSVNSNLDTIVPLPAYTQFINLMGMPGPVTLSVGDRAGMAAIYGAGPPLSSVVTNTLDTAPGSLRAALYYAFDHPGTRITFNIPTSDPGYTNGIFTIQPSDQLPSLVNATTIEGASQPSTNTNGPAIQINGATAPTPSTFANGLRLGGTNCTVHALTLNGFSASGILVDTTNATGNTVAGCFLGTDSSGSLAVTNGLSPVTIQNGANGNTIGGIAVSNRNVISGSVFQGVVIRDPATHNNFVSGNYIGLNAAGTAALPNGFSGVGIVNGAHDNTIGGTAPGAGNVISGNAIQGIALRDHSTTNNLIEGNIIGLNPAGTSAIPNAAAGVEIFLGAQSNFIGGTSSGARNIISGNTFQGVLIDGAGTSGNVVEGNYVGLNATGTAAVPNAGAGVALFSGAQSNLIGGNLAVTRNIISGNTLQGVAIGNSGTTGNIVAGNYIGLNPAGTAAIPNLNPGVNLFDGAQGNTIGGLTAAAGNVVSGNAGQGVSLQDFGTSGNFILGNLIGLNANGNGAVSNAGVGIELFFSANGNTIGGGNVISGNNDDGVLLDNGASSNIVQGNFIGLDTTGTTAIPNAGSGVEMFVGANDNLIGGSGGRNYISGNSKSGILIDDGVTNEIVQGNTIGLNVSGIATPNLNAGVGLFGGVQGNLIGGVLPGQANLIADNGGGGVELYDADTTNNTIRGNSIFGNASGFGIYLYLANNSGTEATPNLTGADNTGSLTITGNMVSLPNTTFHFDFYANPASSVQGTTYLGARDFMTGPDGTVSFTAQLPARILAGSSYYITTTATDPAGNTTQLSDGQIVRADDFVGDGIPNAWREANFFGDGTTTNNQSCATCDPDHDGFNNLDEFLAGTDPNDPASNLRVGSAVANGPDLVVSFASVSGIIYRVEYKNDLAATGWSILADQIIGTGSIIQLSDLRAAALPTRYYRVDVLP